MKEIFDSIQPVIQNSQWVSINNSAIDQFIDSIQPSELAQSEFDIAPPIPAPTEENYIGFTLVYNTINFCYWGNPKWTIEVDEKEYDGSYGLTQAFIRGLNEGYGLLNPRYLSTISENDLHTILRGNIQIPLFQERLSMLRKIGSLMIEKFNGVWINVIKKGAYDAEKIVQVLVNDLPEIFKDEAIYNGKVVKFYKRAQLVPAYINHDLYTTRAISTKIESVEKLTAFADYKVPQILRKFGILKYKDELEQKIDSLTELSSGSMEEIEIRANTIEAVERITKQAKEKFPTITASRVDAVLWFRGQIKSPDDKPYHRTKTIWY